MRLAVIIPVRERDAPVEACLRQLAGVRRRGHRVVVVGSLDGGSLRACVELADRVVEAPAGWARQANAGSRAPEVELADALLFVPASVQVPEDADRIVAQALANSSSPWGRFDLCYRRAPGGTGAGVPLPLRFAAALANAGSRLTGICTRDQAIFVTRAAFLALEGFAGPEAASDETADIEFSRRARQLGAPIALRQCVAAPVGELRSFALLRAAARREWLRIAGALGVAGGPRGAISPPGT